jgi:hypothetical protein
MTNPQFEIRNSQLRWLPDMDLNHDKQIQSLLCYRYTIGQVVASQSKESIRGVKTGTHRLRIANCELPIETPLRVKIRNPKSEIRN